MSYEAYVEGMEGAIRKAVFDWLAKPDGEFNGDAILAMCPPDERGQMLGVALCRGTQEGVRATVDWAMEESDEGSHAATVDWRWVMEEPDEGSHACNN